MLNAVIKLLASKLNGVLLLVTLTGFVCTHKIQAEGECLSSSNIHCYYCDSISDPNCADPFDFPPLISSELEQSESSNHCGQSLNTSSQVTDSRQTKNENVTHPVKKRPYYDICHGCCVKIVKNMSDGALVYRRTCSTVLNINYFLLGYICMNQSDDRGRMCFCETELCNGHISIHNNSNFGLLLTIITLLYMMTNRTIYLPLTNFFSHGLNMCT